MFRILPNTSNKLIQNFIRKIIIFLLIFIIQPQNVFSNSKDYIGFQINYNYYKLNSLQTLSNDIVDYYNRRNIQVHEFGKYPAYFEYQIDYIHPLNSKTNLGLFIGFSSTGNKISYSDYSGELNNDFLLTRIVSGWLGEQALININPYIIYMATKLCISYSTLEINESITIYDQREEITTKCKAWSVSILPSINILFNLNKFTTKIEVGYEHMIYNYPLFLAGNKDAKSRNDNNEYIVTDWDGLRIGILFGIKL